MVEDGPWQVLFHPSFKSEFRAVVLCGGGKGGVSQEKFYRALIEKADRRFDEWLKETDE